MLKSYSRNGHWHGGQVLYNLCEWPAREGSRLVVIGIANHHQMDLAARLLPRIASRLGSRRCVRMPTQAHMLCWHMHCLHDITSDLAQPCQSSVGILMFGICRPRLRRSSKVQQQCWRAFRCRDKAVHLRRVNFKPYTRDQLQAIIAQRLLDAGVRDAFEAKAIRYAAGKVGALTSPRALSLSTWGAPAGMSFPLVHWQPLCDAASK